MKILFICTAGQQRSPTGADFIKREYPWHEAKFAGIHPLADIRITPEAIEWADLIFAMENMHKDYLLEHFQDKIIGKNVIVLGIPDIYERNDSQLIELIGKKMRSYIKD